MYLSVVKVIASLCILHCILSTVHWWIKMNNIWLWCSSYTAVLSNMSSGLTDGRRCAEPDNWTDGVAGRWSLSSVSVTHRVPACTVIIWTPLTGGQPLRQRQRERERERERLGRARWRSDRLRPAVLVVTSGDVEVIPTTTITAC